MKELRKLNNNFFPIVVIVVYAFMHSQAFSQEDTMGMLEHDSTKSFDGLTLLIPKNYTSTYLINNLGAQVHKWDSQYLPAMSAYLLEDGTLLRSAKVEDESSDRDGGFQLLDWDSNVLWEYYAGRQHHDIEPLPYGNVLLILNDVRSRQEVLSAGRDPGLLDSNTNNIRTLKIIEVEKVGQDSGKIVWEWNLWDHLIQEYSDTLDNFGVVADHPELVDINFGNTGANWTHVNSIDYNPDLDQIIVSSRTFNEIWIIDHSTTTEEAASHAGGNSGMGGDILYRWGNPIAYQAGTSDEQKLFSQHDATWIGDELSGAGNIMVFNNGIGRPDGAYSTIDEFTPPVDDVGQYSRDPGSAFQPDGYTWSFQADPPEDFYSPRWSGAQRLPNGNTVMCSGDQSMIIEVTEIGEIVWKYINPVSSNGPLLQGEPLQDNHLGRVQKYGRDHPGFDGRDLIPGGPIEGTQIGVEPERGVPAGFLLYDNYPNPFNSGTKITFEISEKSYTAIKVYDITGRLVNTLVNEIRNVGIHEIIWNGTDESGNSISGGVYIYELRVNDSFTAKKMLLLK
jgi:hypothetical protein